MCGSTFPCRDVIEAWLKRDVLPASGAGIHREFGDLDRALVAVDDVEPSRAGRSAEQTAGVPEPGVQRFRGHPAVRSELLKRTTALSMVQSLTLPGVRTTARGKPRPSQARWTLVVTVRKARQEAAAVPEPKTPDSADHGFWHESGTRYLITAHNKKARVADLGLLHGAGDENRTRALSLGSDGARAAVWLLACMDSLCPRCCLSLVAPLLTVVVRFYGHAVGTASHNGRQGPVHERALRMAWPVGEVQPGGLRACTRPPVKCASAHGVDSRASPERPALGPGLTSWLRVRTREAFRARKVRSADGTSVHSRISPAHGPDLHVRCKPSPRAVRGHQGQGGTCSDATGVGRKARTVVPHDAAESASVQKTGGMAQRRPKPPEADRFGSLGYK